MRTLAIVGPTASGKSALAVAVAMRWGAAEIVSTDSMQVYRGMDIGTATPSTDEQQGIVHRMIDVWDPEHAVSVAEFQALARHEINEAAAGGSLPIVVGGSGLYVSAVLDDLRFPGTDPQIRGRLEAELQTHGPEVLHRRLEEVDPAAAAEILPSNGRRIVRALEVIELTGQPFVARLPEPVDLFDTLRVGLEIPRDVLDDRIARRVDEMWAAGFVQEVRVLAGSDLRSTPTASRALGYQQVLDFLSGDITESQAREQTVEATRRFARRQQRWFRRDSRIHWMSYDSPSLVDDVVELVRSAAST